MAETADLEQSISDLSAHLRGISDELAAERKARADEKKNGISVLHMHVPLPIVLGLVSLLLGTGTVLGVFLHDVSGHMADSNIHVNAEKATKGDGIAYVRDVRTELESKASDLEAAIRRNGVAIKSGAKCRTTGKKDSWICEFTDPDTLPLRGPRFSAP